MQKKMMRQKKMRQKKMRQKKMRQKKPKNPTKKTTKNLKNPNPMNLKRLKNLRHLLSPKREIAVEKSCGKGESEKQAKAKAKAKPAPKAKGKAKSQSKSKAKAKASGKKTQEKIQEEKALLSRKSAAYHRARVDAEKNGADKDAAKAIGRKAYMFMHTHAGFDKILLTHEDHACIHDQAYAECK